MKKLISLFLAVTMLLSLCSFALADDVVELELVFHKPEASAIAGLQAVIDAFNAQNPGIRVVLNQIPDTETVMQTRAQTNEMPDMFSCATSTMYEIMFADGIILAHPCRPTPRRSPRQRPAQPGPARPPGAPRRAAAPPPPA